MYPVKLISPLKDYLWGGTRLKKDFNKKSDLDIVAESWELACHKDGESIIENGEFSGKTLSQYINGNGKSILGTNCDRFDNFPVLIKLIDAKDNLSVQVHPDNDYALKNEGEPGKTEMWYIVDCEDNAELVYGFKDTITKEEFKKKIEDNTLLDVVKKVKVNKGDVFFIKSGTLHAIGKGILIAEIQQNSNTTYRVYDYGRIGPDGKPRQLHIDKAIEVTDLSPTPEYTFGETESCDGYTKRVLSECEYFKTQLLTISRDAELFAGEKSFHSILLIEGNASLKYDNGELELQKGDSVFIPANMGNYKIYGECQVIFTTV
jgi:mannose-6-phosphate isomerase